MEEQVQTIQQPTQTNTIETVSPTTATSPSAESSTSEGKPEKKKTPWWVWLMIALIVIGSGVIVYFQFFK